MLWFQEMEQSFPALRGRHKADVCIVGGGLSGLTAALWLSRTGLKVAVLEAKRFGGGMTSCCAGKVVFPLWTRLSPLDESSASEYVNTVFGAIQSVKEMNGKGDFDWQDAPLCLFAETEDETAFLTAEYNAMKKSNLSVEGMEACPVPSRMAVRMHGTGAVNVGKYLSFLIHECLSNHCALYENSRVAAVEADRVLTETASLMAPYIVIATGYPIVNIPGWYFMRMEQRAGLLQRWKGQVSPDIYMNLNGATAIRPLGDGSLAQACGSYIGNRRNDEALDNRVRELTRNLQMEKMGEAIHCIDTCTADGLPYAGPYSTKTPNMFVAAGYNGAGIIGSVIAAKAISASILGLPTDAYQMFSPKRALTVFKMPLSIGARYMGEWFRRPRAPRCPHLGCKLIYNPHTRIWECPCHGSRFDDIGHVLNTPAIRPAILKDRR